MLSTYHRVLKEWKRVYIPGIKARLERERPYDDRHVVPGVVVALLIKRAEDTAKGRPRRGGGTP